MTLEDFFTPTEMSNGLTAPARVHELVSIMQKEREHGVEDAIEITRRWSTVASTIAATENKECLELFIQLDGLDFMDCWLKDAQKLGSDPNGSLAEDTITLLLRAVEKLHVDKEKSVSSGIMVTVKNLLAHTSSKIQERSRTLFDSWEKEKNDDAVSRGDEEVHTSTNDGTMVIANPVEENVHSEPSLRGISPSRSEEEKCEKHNTENRMLSSTSDDAHPSTVGDNMALDQNLQHIMLKDGSSSSPPLTKAVSENKETHAVVTCSTTGVRNSSFDEQTDVISESTNSLNRIQEVVSPEKADSAVPEQLDEKTLSSDPDASEVSEAVSGLDLRSQDDVKDVDNVKEKPSADDASVDVSKGKLLMDNSVPAGHGKSDTVIGAKEDRKYNIDLLQDFSDKHNLEHHEELSTALMKVDVVDGDEKDVFTESEDDQENDIEFEVPQRGNTICSVLEKKSDIELDYGMIDPLEVARQVALEVEREVEENSSSSEKTREYKFHDPHSPDSRSGNSPNKEELQGMPVLAEASVTLSEAGPANGTEKLESSQITDAAMDLESNDKKSFCDFDLNLEVCSEDIDCPGNPVSTSISVVSASRAAAACGTPVPPLQFEGTLGWKGSAATSAFRPASPRKIPESDKVVSSGGSDSISKQQQSCLDIDLNVAEGGDDRLADLITGKQVSVTSALPSGESSVEASPKNSARLELDLNCASEEGLGEAPTNWLMERRLFSERADQNHSPSSSSSSKQQSFRNFDLNDQPTYFHHSSDLPFFKKPSEYTHTSGGIKSGDSVVSIMGVKVEVNHKDPVPRSAMFPNGRMLENAVDLSVARSGFLGMGAPFPYSNSPASGYNGITPGPSMLFPSGMYGPGGPIPYLVDPRGPPVMPQFMGSASAIPPSFSHQPFVISMTGPHVSNGVAPSRSSLDLNTGLILDGGTRDHGVTRQLFNQGPARYMDDHFRTISEPSTSSSIGGKRKEPDDGWDPFPFKRHPSLWK